MRIQLNVNVGDFDVCSLTNSEGCREETDEGSMTLHNRNQSFHLIALLDISAIISLEIQFHFTKCYQQLEICLYSLTFFEKFSSANVVTPLITF